MSSSFRVRRHRRALALVVLPLMAVSLVDVPVAGASAPPPSGPIKVIQNYSEAIVSGVGKACSLGGSSTENHWYRRFDLSAGHGVAKAFLVSEVVVGVDHATSADGILPGRVDVWAIDKTDPLQVANLEPLASVPVNWDSASDLSLKTVPVSAVVPTGKDLVIEAMAEAGSAGESFSVGANSAPELADDYLSSSVCGPFVPTPVSALGFGSSNHVLYARGKAMDCLDAEAAVVPAEPPVASAAAAVAKAKGAKSKATKKLRRATKAYTVAVADHGRTSAQAQAAKAKLKKAKKRKSAKAAALKQAKAALAAATATLEGLTGAARAECAQPALPPRR